MAASITSGKRCHLCRARPVIPPRSRPPSAVSRIRSCRRGCWPLREVHYLSLDPEKRAEGLRQARELGFIVGSFVAGAVAGALLAPRHVNHTLWLPLAILLVVLIVAMRRSIAQLPATRPVPS